MAESIDTMVDFAIDLFLKEREKVREIYMQAPELGRIPAMLKHRQSVVERLAEEMKTHHPGKESEEYIRVSFIAVNSLMGVIHTMLYDEQQSYKNEQLSYELKMMLNAYFSERTGASGGYGA